MEKWREMMEVVMESLVWASYMKEERRDWMHLSFLAQVFSSERRQVHPARLTFRAFVH